MAQFKNRDRLIELGIAIATLRKLRGMSQEELAVKAGISRSLLSAIEAPNMAKSFVGNTLLYSRCIKVEAGDLLNTKLRTKDK